MHEADIAWHAGNWTYNTRSIGIEHEGYVGESGWFTDAMYRARPVNGVLLQEAHHRVQRSAWLP